MKKPSDQLFRLIHAMTPSEKRYFKMHFTDSSSATTFLFDMINKQKQYDEERLKLTLPSNISKNLKVFKVQLQNLLLKSLQLSARNKQIYAQIRQGLEEVDILFEKQLYDIANDRLEKVKKLCEKHEAFTYLVEIGYKRFSIKHVNLDGKDMSKNPIFEDLKTHVKAVSDHFQFTMLSQELMEKARALSYKVSNEDDRAYLESLLNGDLMSIPSEELPFQTRISRNSILTFIHALLEQPEEENSARKRNVDLFEQFPHFKQSLPIKYIGVLRNYLNYCSESKQHQEVGKIIRTAEAFTQKNKKMGVQLIHFYYANLALWFNEGRFRLILEELEQKIGKHISSYKIEGERIAFLNFFYLAIAHLALGQNKQTQFYIRKLNLSFKRVDPQDVHAANLLELINHHEAKDTEIARNRLHAFLRKEKGQVNQKTFYHRMLDLFKGVLKHPDKTKTLARALLEELPTYKKDPTFVVAESHLIIDWIYALDQRSNFKDYIKRKYRHQVSRASLD